MLPSSFPDVPVRVDAATCAVCRRRFAPGDRRVEVKLVAGVGGHPVDGRPVVFLSDVRSSEWAHGDCANPKLATPRIVMPNVSRPAPSGVRDSDTKCATCGKPFRRGDRVAVVFVVVDIGVDPETKQRAARCHDDHEHVHLRCQDPGLVGEGAGLVNL